jgi:hypothetical protein
MANASVSSVKCVWSKADLISLLTPFVRELPLPTRRDLLAFEEALFLTYVAVGRPTSATWHAALMHLQQHPQCLAVDVITALCHAYVEARTQWCREHGVTKLLFETCNLLLCACRETLPMTHWALVTDPQLMLPNVSGAGRLVMTTASFTRTARSRILDQLMAYAYVREHPVLVAFFDRNDAAHSGTRLWYLGLACGVLLMVNVCFVYLSWNDTARLTSTEWAARVGAFVTQQSPWIATVGALLLITVMWRVGVGGHT